MSYAAAEGPLRENKMTGPKAKASLQEKQDRIAAANYLYFEQNMPTHKIKVQLKISEPYLDKILFHSLREWREFRNGLGK